MRQEVGCPYAWRGGAPGPASRVPLSGESSLEEGTFPRPSRRVPVPRMIREGLVVMALLAATGCGSDDKRAGAPGAAETSEGTQTTTPASTPTPKPAPKRARSVRGCVKLWNADALPPGNYQVSANEFVAKLAPVRVHVAYQGGDCFVVWPIGGRRIGDLRGA